MKRLAVTLAVLAFGVAVSGTAGAATPCSEQILNEWLRGAIKTTHPISCYDRAIEDAPEEVVLYQDFPQQVLAAKRAALRAQRQPPSDGGSQGGKEGAEQPPSPPPAAEPAGPDPVVEPASPPEPAPQVDVPVVEDVPSTQGSPPPAPAPPAEPAPSPVAPAEQPSPVEPEPVPVEPSDGPLPEAIAALGPSNARSVPAPLIALSLITGLLALAGVSVLGMRYLQARRVTPLPPPRPRDADDGGAS